jgi:HAD superfamily hydrolase (TIGR01509 family)
MARYIKIKINYILVDIHGVLTQGDERKKFISFVSQKFSIDPDIHNSIWLKHLPELDMGHEKAKEYINDVNKTFKTNFKVNSYFQQFANQIVINRKLINWLKKNANKVCITSDNVRELSQAINKIFRTDFINFQKYYSYQFLKTKSAGMLENVIKKLNTNPNKCLFIDDNKINIEVAKEIGINAILFKNNQELFSELKKYKF